MKLKDVSSSSKDVGRENSRAMNSQNWQDSESAVTMVEYALMVALIALIAISAVSFLGNRLSAQFSSTASQPGLAP